MEVKNNYLRLTNATLRTLDNKHQTKLRFRLCIDRCCNDMIQLSDDVDDDDGMDNTDKSKYKHLLSIPMFWIATLSPLFVSTILMCVISYYDNLSIAAWNSHNIGIAYTHFKVPLVIASLSFPLGAVVIASHRSAQTLMMADLQSSQNRFANYFLHLDRFSKAMEVTDFHKAFPSLRFAHDYLYANLAESGSLDVNISLIKHFQLQVNELNLQAKGVIESLNIPLERLNRIIAPTNSTNYASIVPVDLKEAFCSKDLNEPTMSIFDDINALLNEIGECMGNKASQKNLSLEQVAEALRCFFVFSGTQDIELEYRSLFRLSSLQDVQKKTKTEI
jgi:hypothetical protein